MPKQVVFDPKLLGVMQENPVVLEALDRYQETKKMIERVRMVLGKKKTFGFHNISTTNVEINYNAIPCRTATKEI